MNIILTCGINERKETINASEIVSVKRTTIHYRRGTYLEVKYGPLQSYPDVGKFQPGGYAYKKDNSKEAIRWLEQQLVKQQRGI